MNGYPICVCGRCTTAINCIPKQYFVGWYSPDDIKKLQDAAQSREAALLRAIKIAIKKLSIPLDRRLTFERTMEIREGLIQALDEATRVGLYNAILAGDEGASTGVLEGKNVE